MTEFLVFLSVADPGLGLLTIGCSFYSASNVSRGQSIIAQPAQLCQITGESPLSGPGAELLSTIYILEREKKYDAEMPPCVLR